MRIELASRIGEQNALFIFLERTAIIYSKTQHGGKQAKISYPATRVYPLQQLISELFNLIINDIILLNGVYFTCKIV